MNVFVLCAGRCGSVSFSRACDHLTNFSSGHESLAVSVYGLDRFRYSDNHVEVDNRLSFFLGDLGERFPDAVFVHLVRDSGAAAASLLKRWGEPEGIVHAFARGVLMRADEWPERDRLGVCEFYVDTVNANIREFLVGREHVTVRLENVKQDFAYFLDWVEAEGDLEGALAEWDVYHNAS